MKIYFRKFVVATVAIVASATFCAYGLISDQKVEMATKQLISIIDHGHKELKIPGCVLAVVRHNKVICTKPFGYASADDTSPVTNDTIFPVSSVTKNITALLVGALVDAGKLKWDDKIRKYDKDFFVHSEEYSKDLTIKDLISHSCGFKHFSADSLWYGGYSKKQTVNAFKYLKQIPGNFRKYYGYQNVFFGLIGDILEKATGEKYEDLVQKYLFNRMNMKNACAIRTSYETSRWGHIKYMASRFAYDSNRMGFFNALSNFIKSVFTFSPKQVVTGYAYSGNGISETPEIGFFHVWPATSGIAFSANEFAKWIQMILAGGQYKGNTVVTPETFKTITTPVVSMKHIRPTDDVFPIDRFPREELHYCVGTFVAKYADNNKSLHNVIFHMGGVYGATAFFIVCPEEDIGVGVINNLGGTTHTLFAQYMCHNFLDLCFDFSKKDWMNAETNRLKKYKDYKNKAVEQFSNYLTPMASIQKYQGVFNSDIYGKVNFQIKNGKLFLSNGIMSTELDHVNGNIFSFPEKNMQINYSNVDSYVAFYPDESKNFTTCRITCFNENDTIFKKEINDVK